MNDNRKAWIAFSFTAVICLILDQATKFLARNNLSDGKSVSIIKGFLSFSLVKNTGVAFGLFKGQILLFQLSAILIAVAVIFYFLKFRPSSLLIRISLGLILAGSLGNLIDRVLFSRVTDFIDFHFWPVFNVADSTIVVGAAILLAKYIFKDERQKTKILHI